MLKDKAAIDADQDEMAIVHARVSLGKYLCSTFQPTVLQKFSEDVNGSVTNLGGPLKRFEDLRYIRQRCDKIRELPAGNLDRMVALFSELDRKAQESLHLDPELWAALTDFRQAFSITDEARESYALVKNKFKDIMLEALNAFVLNSDQNAVKSKTASTMKKSFSPLATQMGQLTAFSLTPKDDYTNLELMKALFEMCTNREAFEKFADVCIDADTLQKTAEAIESNGVVFKKTSSALKQLTPVEFFKDRIGWLLASGDCNHDAISVFVGEMQTKFAECKKKVEELCVTALTTPKTALLKSMTALEPSSTHAVANKVKLEKQRLTDLCASAKSQLEAFGESDVLLGEQEGEQKDGVGIIASCDELLSKTEAKVFHWGVETFLGDSRIGAVDQGSVLRKSLQSIVDAFSDHYSSLGEEVLACIYPT